MSLPLQLVLYLLYTDVRFLEKPRLIDPGKQARLTPESKISLTPFE